MPDVFNPDSVRAFLLSLKNPTSGLPLLLAENISSVVVRDAMAGCVLTLGDGDKAGSESLRRAVETALLSLSGVQKAQVILTSEVAATDTAPPQRAAHKRPPAAGKMELPQLKNIIAVASGKGGVGKSTTAVNLAAAFLKQGLRVGILDADIYGPSLPRLLNLTERPPYLGDKKMAPLEKHGLFCMSLGLMVDAEKPVIWRGPMVMGAIEQMFRDVVWPELDVLVVDMPPGTGDAQLTLAQRIPVTGAVIVSTPQDLALLDARKGLKMFQQTGVPVLGIVENMSFYCCPQCGHRAEIFGHGGARDEAERLGVPFLGEIPLHLSIRESSDNGLPIVLSAPESAHAAAYRGVAGLLAQAFNKA